MKKIFTISVTLDKTTYKEMEEIRENLRMNRSEYVRQALIEAEKKYNTELERKNFYENN